MDWWNDFWGNWRSGCEIIGDNLVNAFDNVGKRYQQAGDHFNNGHWGSGLWSGTQATLGALGNIATFGGANALGNGLANTLEVNEDGEVKIKEEYDNGFTRVAHFIVGSDTDAQTELSTQRYEQGANDCRKLAAEHEAKADEAKAKGYEKAAKWHSDKAEELRKQAEEYDGAADTMGNLALAFQAVDFIPVGKALSAAGRGGKKLVSKVTGKALQKGTEEIVEKAIKRGTVEVAENMTAKLTNRMVAELGEDVVQKVGKETIEKVGKKVSTELVQEAGEKTVQTVSEKLVKELTKEAGESIGKKTAQNLGKKLGKELVEEFGEETAESIIQRTANATAKNIAGKTAKKSVKSKVFGVAAMASLHRGSGYTGYRYVKGVQDHGLIGGTVKEAWEQSKQVLSDANAITKDAAALTVGCLFPRLTCFCNTCKALVTASEQKWGDVKPVAYVVGARKKILGFGKYSNKSFKDMANDQIASAKTDNNKTFKELYQREVKVFDHKNGLDSSKRKFFMSDDKSPDSYEPSPV